MLNIIKMDFYRMFKTVSFWVSLAVTAGIAVVTSLFINLFDTGINYSLSFILNNIISVTYILIINTIFLSIFIHAEFKNGFIKNFAGQVKPRCKLIISKLFILASYIIILPLVYLLFVILTFFLAGNGIKFDFSADMFIIIAVELLLYFAFGSIIIMLCIFSNSNALSIAIGIMMSVGIFSIVYIAIDYIVQKIAPYSTFSSDDYSLITNVKYIASIYESSHMIRAVCVGIAFSAAAIALSVLALQKKDIK